jgi:hypothetical protein
LLSQETLTKNLFCGFFWSRNLDKNVFIENKGYFSQGLPVEKKALITAAFVSVLLLSAVAGTQFVNLGQANPYIRHRKMEKTIPPPEGTKPPVVSISSPKNHSYPSTSFLLNFTATIEKSNDISLSVNEIYYLLSWKRERTDVDRLALFLKNNYTWPPTYSINLTGVPEGPHWIEVFAVATAFAYETRRETKGIYQTTYYAGYEITGSSRIDFTIDTTAPSVSSLSVTNMTYAATDVPIMLKINEPVLQVSYSLDGRRNLTAAGNITLTGLTRGEHSIAVFATDLAGNIGASETVTFTIAEPEPESLPSTVVMAPIASVAFVGVGLLVYLKRRK